MKKIITLGLMLFSVSLFAQKNLTEKAQPIVAEEKLLYRSEMASWYGTDLFMEKYVDKNNIGGYFSYPDGDFTTCVFYSRTASPRIIGTVRFDTTFNVKTAAISLEERALTSDESDLYQIREKAWEKLNTNKDSLFKFYKNSSPNLIPLVDGKQRKVYVLTGPKDAGVIIFGNDYLLEFDKKNRLTGKKQLHRNILMADYNQQEEDGNEIAGGMHSHAAETGDYITATDICTLMLYGRFTKWKT